jgi:hypothetical protein
VHHLRGPLTGSVSDHANYTSTDERSPESTFSCYRLEYWYPAIKFLDFVEVEIDKQHCFLASGTENTTLIEVEGLRIVYMQVKFPEEILVL